MEIGYESDKIVSGDSKPDDFITGKTVGDGVFDADDMQYAGSGPKQGF